METAKFEKLKAIDKLLPGPEMDTTIAAQIIKMKSPDDYSTLAAASLKVVDKLNSLGFFVVDGRRGEEEFTCTVVKNGRDLVTSYETTLPMARCRAALKVILED